MSNAAAEMEPTTVVPMTVSRPVILRTESLQKSYGMGKVAVRALRGVDLEVKKGEFVAIMGDSGSGKSTLLHVLGGLLRPSAGRVWIDGHDLTLMSDAERTELRRRKIGFVFQRFNLIPTLSVEGNLRLAERIYGEPDGDSELARARRERLLRLLGLADKFGARPNGISGGEQQRVAMARALIHRPSIVLADEPTGNLDSTSAARVLSMMAELNASQGETMVMITHNQQAANYATRLILMRDGKIRV